MFGGHGRRRAPLLGPQGGEWDGWQYTVVAEAASGVQSLTPRPDGQGCSATYGVQAADGRAVARRIEGPPAAPEIIGQPGAVP